MSEQPNGAPLSGGALSVGLDRTLTVMNTIGSAWVFVLMLIIDVDAFSRTLFAHPFYGVLELVELSIVGIVFMQLGDATRRGRLTRSDGFFNLVKRHRPRTGRVMGAVFDFLGVLFLVIVLFGAVPEMRDAWVHNYFVGEEGLFTAPEWPIKLVIVLGCLVTLLQFLRIGIQYLNFSRPMSPQHPSSPD